MFKSWPCSQVCLAQHKLGQPFSISLSPKNTENTLFTKPLSLVLVLVSLPANCERWPPSDAPSNCSARAGSLREKGRAGLKSAIGMCIGWIEGEQAKNNYVMKLTVCVYQIIAQILLCMCIIAHLLKAALQPAQSSSKPTAEETTV